MFYIFSCKRKTAYDWRISDWSSDVCSSDLPRRGARTAGAVRADQTGFGAAMQAASTPMRHVGEDIRSDEPDRTGGDDDDADRDRQRPGDRKRVVEGTKVEVSGVNGGRRII